MFSDHINDHQGKEAPKNFPARKCGVRSVRKLSHG
jgi:hypothetical protein